jgi:3-oxoadipate enol-lactonase
MPIARLADVRMHYRVDGDAASPPLLLSNSLGASLEMWEPQLAALTGRFHVIRYDSRGHGQSEATPGPYSIAALANDALQLLDQLAIPRAHFCGLSMGGMVGLWIGINAPARLDRLVLANTAARIGSADMWNARIDAVRKGGTAAIASAVLARWFTPALLDTPTPIVAQMRATFERTSTEGYAASCAAVRDADLRHMLGRIHARTLVIGGTDDGSTPPNDTRYVADHIANARYVELAAPHLSNVQAAPAFTQALVQFLTGRME